MVYCIGQTTHKNDADIGFASMKNLYNIAAKELSFGQMNKSTIHTFNSHVEAEWDGFVADRTPEERLLMVWELTRNAYILEAAMRGQDEPEFLTKGLQRHLVSFEEIRR